MHPESHTLHKNNKKIKLRLKIIHKTQIKLCLLNLSNNRLRNKLILRKKNKNWCLWGQLPSKTVQMISQPGIFLTKGSEIWKFHSPPKNH